MKRLLIGLFIFGSLSASATQECVKSSSLGTRVCAEVVEGADGFIIKNIVPNIQKKKSIAVDLCESFGDEFTDYDVDIVKGKACRYYGTKGFHAGSMVQSCLDLGALFRGTIISKVKCFID